MTTNSITNNSKIQKSNQWFAGVTDPNGCFYMNKKHNHNNIRYEITTHTIHIPILYSIQNTLKTGKIIQPSGSQSVRYRTKQKAAIVEIANRLNGPLYNQGRFNQFQNVWKLFNISFIPSPATISKQNA